MNFTGLTAYALTPTDPDGALRHAEFAQILERIIAAGMDAICILGSTGGYAYLTLEQRKTVMAAAAEIIDGRVPVIMGVGALRSDHAAELARDAARLGAAGLLLAPVSYAPLLDDEVFAHYAHVAGQTDLPLCIYNNPAATHFTFSHELLARIAALPMVTSVKSPRPGHPDGDAAAFSADLAVLRDVLPDDFTLGYSADEVCGSALLHGAGGFHSGIAGILPAQMLALARAGQAGDAADVAARTQALSPLWQLCAQYGGLRVSYAIARHLGLSEAAPLRPLLPIAALPAALRNILDETKGCP